MIQANKRIREETNKYKEEYNCLSGDKYQYETEIKAFFKETKRRNDNTSKLKKQIEELKKEYKKEELYLHQSESAINDHRIALHKLGLDDAEIKKLISEEDDIKIKVDEDIKLLEGKRRVFIDKTLDKNNEKASIDKQIIELEKEIVVLQNTEILAHKTIKNLTTMRESMARKASQAMAEVRETREDLKIKELLILDLRKKQQETEFKLNSFKALYEEVKSARNKYVNLIQNSSQDLAELKERIKILHNELEILKNESIERDRTLMEYKHILQLEVHRRDRRHAKLNKLEITKKQKKEIVDQNINEIEKLNQQILLLEKEMLKLRQLYEDSCQSRNYAGIQLIDRNDELCILYEKSNIQENILKNGDQEVNVLEDDIRMIQIEIGEVKRKLGVTQKNIENVPLLAEKVIMLKNELELEKQKEKKASYDLENPENLNRWRELEGDDPEEEALEAKIQILEERLNSKKEALLEKELILDEITNLSDKLRKQAVDGRQGTLETSEKVNSFQTRLKDLTRKMMSTISELSMFQATAIKLQNERDGIEQVLNFAQDRISQGLGPLPETEIEYLKMVRDKKRYIEENQQRKQRELVERNIPPFATRTTAEHRVNAYYPDPNIRISKPYGHNTPFKPTVLGSNMRHFRNPNPKEIEI